MVDLGPVATYLVSHTCSSLCQQSSFGAALASYWSAGCLPLRSGQAGPMLCTWAVRPFWTDRTGLEQRLGWSGNTVLRAVLRAFQEACCRRGTWQTCSNSETKSPDPGLWRSAFVDHKPVPSRHGAATRLFAVAACPALLEFGRRPA